MGNTPCGQGLKQMKVQLNAIHMKYKPDNQNSFQVVKKQYLQYPQKYPYILSFLNENNLKFIDEYFNGLRMPDVVLGSQFYIYTNYQSVQLKRINEFIKSKSYTIYTIMQSGNSYRVANTYKALNWIMKQSNIIKNIFRIQELNKEGLVLAYIPFYGSSVDPTEIIIDNYVPTIKNKYYSQIPQNSPIGIILLEKVLAKYFGSYEAVRNKKGIQLFETLTGIPIISQNIGAQQEINILKKYYNPSFKLTCLQQNFQSKRSSYLKLTLHQRCLLSLAIWQFKETQYIDEIFATEDIIVELMRKNEKLGHVQRVGYASKAIDNKTILRAISPQQENYNHIGSQLIDLQAGDYYAHVLSLSDNKEITGNIIIYSEHETNAFYRKQSIELDDIKKKMIQYQFRKRLASIKSNLQQIECNNVKSHFVWDGYRGILQIINHSNTKIIINLSINVQYRSRIFFQKFNEYYINIQIGVKSSKIVSFIKIKNIDLGRFYKIQLGNNHQLLAKKITTIQSPQKNYKF